LLEFVNYTADKIQALLLISFRAGGLFIAAPLISRNSIPVTIKAGLSILLAIMLIPAISLDTLPEMTSIWLLAVMAAKEMLVGFIIGFFFSILFHGIRMAGGIIGYQSGLMMAHVLDPDATEQVSMVAEFWLILGTLIFLAIDGHHAIISGFADSYKVLPIGAVGFSGTAGEMLIKYSAYAFVIAIKISAPVMITLFLVSVALGVIARTVPQMNIFIVGIPIKIGIGFLIMALSLPVFRILVDRSVYFLDSQVLAVVSGLNGV